MSSPREIEVRSEELATLDAPAAQPITARLAGAGSLRQELEALLAAAPIGASAEQYHDLLLKENVAGKRSATARMWAWKRLKLRYALDPDLAEHQAFVAGMRTTSDPAERGLLCFLMFARTDRLFREVTFECVSPHLHDEGTIVEPTTVEEAVRQRAAQAGLRWSTNTLDRVHGHLLTALKDFGFLRGARLKRTVAVRPGLQVVLFAARLARLQGLTDRQALDSCWFRLLGMTTGAAAEALYTAHRAGTLTFRMQADVVELTLPPVAVP